MSIQELVIAANKLSEPDLEQLLQQIVALRDLRKEQARSEPESQLLLQIGQEVPAELRTNYQALRSKKEAETLTEQEHETLIDLSNQIEQIGTQRLTALVTLSQLRQVSLSDLMETLGIQSVTYV